MNGVSGGDVPAASNAPLGAGAAAGGLSAGAGVAPALTSPTRELAGDSNTGKNKLVVSGTSGAVGSERVLTPSYAGPLASKDGQGGNERTENQEKEIDGSESVQEQEGKTAAGRVGAFLAALPLSKLKIVIGKDDGFQ